MELTLENLVNEIVKKEFECYNSMIESKYIFGEESQEYILCKTNWLTFYNIAHKFRFVDKLKR